MQRREFLQQATVLAGTLAAAPALSAAQVDTSADVLAPYKAIDDPSRLRGIPGALIRFHLRSPETGGAFTLFEAWAKPGMEPSPHVHQHEDETMILRSGKVLVGVGEEEFELGAGESIFMPRRIPHRFKILSEKMHVFLLINPGDFGEYFWEFGSPLEEAKIPDMPTEPPPPEMISRMTAELERYGISPAP